MRQATAAAEIARDAAEYAGKATAQAERKADSAARAATGPVGALSRVAGGSSTSSVTQEWVGEITDNAALRKSLGVLGEHFSFDVLEATVSRCVKFHVQRGSIASLKIAGVLCEQRDKTNIRAARR